MISYDPPLRNYLLQHTRSIIFHRIPASYFRFQAIWRLGLYKKDGETMDKTCSHSDTFIQRVIDFQLERVYELETCHECKSELCEVITGEDLSEEWELLRKYSSVKESA